VHMIWATAFPDKNGRRLGQPVQPSSFAGGAPPSLTKSDCSDIPIYLISRSKGKP
jgi:hypothetical protein